MFFALQQNSITGVLWILFQNLSKVYFTTPNSTYSAIELRVVKNSIKAVKITRQSIVIEKYF